MPRIFSEDSREEMRRIMLETGFQLIKKNGLKKTTIADVTKESGIARGTFYNFFESKEEFVYQIIVYKRAQAKEFYEASIKENNGIIDRPLLKKMLLFSSTADYNLFAYLTEEDVTMLRLRWPAPHWRDEGAEEHSSKWFLDLMPDKRADIDWKIFANHLKILGSCKVIGLYEDCLEENLKILIDSIVDYVFGKQL